MRSDWFFSTCHFLTDNSLQSVDKDQQEMRALAEKPRDAVVKFDTYRNVQRYRAVIPAISRAFVNISISYSSGATYDQMYHVLKCVSSNRGRTDIRHYL